MAFKLKNPLKSPLKHNHDWFQRKPSFGEELGPYGFAYGEEGPNQIVRYARSSIDDSYRGGDQEWARFDPNMNTDLSQIDYDNLDAAQKRYYDRFTDPEMRKKFLEQAVYPTGEKVSEEDLDKMIIATLNTPYNETTNVGRKGAEATFMQDNMQGKGPIYIGQGPKTQIRFLPGTSDAIKGEELSHVVTGHLQDKITYDILGSPNEAKSGSDAQGQIASYLNQPSELYGHLYKLGAQLGLEPNEQIESVEELEKRISEAGLMSGNSDLLRLYDTPEERQRVLKALNTIAFQEQKSPGTTKWNQLSAKEMLGDIEQDNQSMYS